MVEELEKDDSRNLEVIERPIDSFYSNVMLSITTSFTNLPKTENDDTEEWNKFLATVWNHHFPKTDKIKDFLRYCIYHTGLVGRFYRIKSHFSLDDVRSFLDDRLRNPNLSWKVCCELHKLARFVLRQTSRDTSLDSNLFLDVHVENSECDIVEQEQDILNIEELPNEKEWALEFHILIYYSRNEEFSSTGSGSRTNCTSNFTDKSKPKSRANPKVVTPSETSSPGQSYSVSKPQTDSKDINYWYKYGARPKDKQYLRKENSGKTKKEKGYEKADKNLTGKSVKPTKRINETIERNSHVSDNVHTKFQELPLPPWSNMSNSKKNFNEARGTVEENRRNLDEFLDSSHSSCSEMVKQRNSPAKRTYSKHSNSELSCHKRLSSKSDATYAAPFIPLTSEENRCYEKYGARPKNTQFSQNSDCETSEVRGERKADDLHVKDEESRSFSRKEFEFLKKFPEFRTGFCSREELAEMSASMRNAQILYHNTIMDNYNFEISSVSSDDDNVESEQPAKEDKCTSGAQQNACLEMPFINFPPPYDEHVDENLNPFMTNIGLQVRESMLRYEIKMFFENYKYLDTALKDNKFADTATNSGKVGSYCDIFPQRDFKDGSISAMDRKKCPENLNILSTFSREEKFNLAIKVLEDLSSNLNYLRDKNIQSRANPKATSLPITSVKSSENNKEYIIDGEQSPPGAACENYGTFRQNLIQNLPRTPSTDEESPPPYSESFQSSPNKHYSTPEKASTYSNLPVFVPSEETNDETKWQDSFDDDMLPDVSEESLPYNSTSDSDATSDVYDV